MKKTLALGLMLLGLATPAQAFAVGSTQLAAGFRPLQRVGNKRVDGLGILKAGDRSFDVLLGIAALPIKIGLPQGFPSCRLKLRLLIPV